AEQKIEVKVGTFPFAASGRALASRETDGMVKLISDAKSDQLLGCHIVGPHASELIAEAALAIEAGLCAEDLALTVHTHPTLSETLMEAAEDVHGIAVHIYNPKPSHGA
ncbi:MAG TPA: dihydrolipoyl dehydrogenase, partial [Planctomycetota bacterium]|nr:dihydrolipoyl dehydrogenase [Planctomycetota bacterium]